MVDNTELQTTDQREVQTANHQNATSNTKSNKKKEKKRTWQHSLVKSLQQKLRNGNVNFFR